MALEGYKSNHNVVYSSKYHCVGTPKYRRAVLVGPSAKRCEQVLRQVTNKYRAEIMALEIMPDHVHVLVEVDPQLGIHRLVKHLKGVSSYTLRQEFRTKWYACFSSILDSEPLPENHDAIGIDVGLESFAVTSDAEIVDNPRWFRAAEKELRRKQRHVSRCTKRSSGWKRACRTVAKLHRHVFHQRNDFQHKLSRELVNNYGIIAVEDLNIQGLAGGTLAKSVHDAAWSDFIRKLSYKAESAGRWLVKVNARGTSQQCPCGAAVPKQLWDRKHHCSACGLETIRDHASALEILRRGLRLRTETPALAGVALEAPRF